MPVVNLYTYKDAIDHLIDYLGADASAEGYRNVRRAIQAAHRVYGSAARWHYSYSRGRINTVALQTTGTVEYIHTGGTYERQLTITSNTWPTWATFGVIVINNIPYQVADWKTTTVITLSANSNPGADIAAGASYSLFRDTYALPSDFMAMDEIVCLNFAPFPMYVHPSSLLIQSRLQNAPAVPRNFSIMGDPDAVGTLAARFYPPPDNVYQFDFIYQRRSRPLLVEDVHAGVVSVSAGSATVTGTGTAFAANHVGAVFRLASSTTIIPDGLEGESPFEVERTIMGVTSATNLTVDAVIASAYTGVKYRISDPVDIEDAAMRVAWQRCCEAQVARLTRMKDRNEAEQAYLNALILAREADNRYFGEQHAGGLSRYPYRLAYMPRGPDVS